MTAYMQGRLARGKKGSPKTYSDNRVCVKDGCDVKLSRYNSNEHCYGHAPFKYPRLRGRPYNKKPSGEPT